VSGARPQRKRFVMAALLVLAALAIGSLLQGPTELPPLRIVTALLGPLAPAGWAEAAEPTDALVVLHLRLPRLLAGLAVGAALGVAGALLQGLFRNPLADPGLLGVTSGGAFGVLLVLVVLPPALAHPAIAPWLLPLAALAGAAGTLILVQALAGRGGRAHPGYLLLTGLAVNAFLAAGVGFLLHRTSADALRRFTHWTLGSLAEADRNTLLAGLPLILLGLVLARRLAHPLNALALGESEAFHLGHDVTRLQRRLVGLSALLAGTSVALAGSVGFIGLVAPHLVRLAAGPDHRFLLTASALVGAVLVITADLIGRLWAAPAELPLGIFTALLGAPFFLALLRHRRRLDLP